MVGVVLVCFWLFIFFFFFQAEDGIRDTSVTGVQTCALPISYISADPNAIVKPPKKGTKVQAFVDGAVKNRRLAAGKMGQVRWRASLADHTDPAYIELFDGAMSLASVADAA